MHRKVCERLSNIHTYIVLCGLPFVFLVAFGLTCLSPAFPFSSSDVMCLFVFFLDLSEVRQHIETYFHRSIDPSCLNLFIAETFGRCATALLQLRYVSAEKAHWWSSENSGKEGESIEVLDVLCHSFSCARACAWTILREHHGMDLRQTIMTKLRSTAGRPTLSRETSGAMANKRMSCPPMSAPPLPRAGSATAATSSQPQAESRPTIARLASKPTAATSPTAASSPLSSTASSLPVPQPVSSSSSSSSSFPLIDSWSQFQRMLTGFHTTGVVASDHPSSEPPSLIPMITFYGPYSHTATQLYHITESNYKTHIGKNRGAIYYSARGEGVGDWRVMHTQQRIVIDEITDILLAKQTEEMKHDVCKGMETRQCLSLKASSGVTVNWVFESTRDLNIFLDGLTRLMNASGKQIPRAPQVPERSTAPTASAPLSPSAVSSALSGRPALPNRSASVITTNRPPIPTGPKPMSPKSYEYSYQ